MSVFEMAGEIYLSMGLITLAISIIGLISILIFPANWQYLYSLFNLIQFVFYLRVGKASYALGSRTDNDFLILSAFFTGLSVAALFTVVIGARRIYIFGLVTLLLISFISVFVSYFLLALGIRRLSYYMVSSKLSIASLLIILGTFVGLLSAIGLIIVGRELINYGTKEISGNKQPLLEGSKKIDHNFDLKPFY